MAGGAVVGVFDGCAVADAKDAAVVGNAVTAD
jgi:hypothetical protein